MAAKRKDFMFDFALPASTGGVVGTRDYWLKQHMLLVIDRSLGCEGLRDFLTDLKEAYERIREARTQVLVITRDSRGHLAAFAESEHIPFPLLSDPKAEVAQKLTGKHVAVLAVDKFSEVYGKWSADKEEDLPPIEHLLSRIELIESECPECGAAAWSTG